MLTVVPSSSLSWTTPDAICCSPAPFSLEGAPVPAEVNTSSAAHSGEPGTKIANKVVASALALASLTSVSRLVFLCWVWVMVCLPRLVLLKLEAEAGADRCGPAVIIIEPDIAVIAGIGDARANADRVGEAVAQP